MVNAELSHSPFLETKVLFNSHEPLVNNAIERYRYVLLATWVDKVPQIFYDEMNDYGSDLFFSGTDADFACTKEAFVNAECVW